MNTVSSAHNIHMNIERRGLVFKIYDGYYNDDVNYTNTASLRTINMLGPNTSNVVNFRSIYTSTNGSVNNDPIYAQSITVLIYYTVLYTGYFLAPLTGSYTFSTTSDDSSFIWIGPEALSGYTVLNALVKNGGRHGAIERTGIINLVAGQYYPIRMVFGQDGGDAVFEVYSIFPDGTKTYNFYNYFYKYI